MMNKEQKNRIEELISRARECCIDERMIDIDNMDVNDSMVVITQVDLVDESVTIENDCDRIMEFPISAFNSDVIDEILDWVDDVIEHEEEATDKVLDRIYYSNL